jgi:sugar lactone lactonase YvrE
MSTTRPRPTVAPAQPQGTGTATGSQVDVCVHARATLGEGVIWDSRNQKVYWVDIIRGQLFEYDPSTAKNVAVNFGQFVSAVVPAATGGLIVARQHDIVRFDPASGQSTRFAALNTDRPDLRFNDGKCDPAGRFWIGTMEVSGQPHLGALYCLGPDGRFELKRSGVTISNGIAWRSDQRMMYYIDTGTNVVTAWDFDPATGQMTGERPCIALADKGHLDGMTIDSENMLWIAVFGTGEVRRYDPSTGRQISAVRLPVSQITSCAFGGVKLQDLYVTSASYDFTPDDWKREPLAGSLFRIRDPGAQGVVLPQFAG